MTYPEGIDVSLWQSKAVVEAYSAGKKLIIVKVSQRDFVDPAKDMHFATARAAKPDYLGGYHWLDPQPSAEDQAALYLRNVPADVDFHAVDVEAAILKVGGSYAYARDMARRFIAYIHAHDHRPVLQYSSRGTWPGDNGQDGNWVADYTGDPERLFLRLTRQAVSWVVWQYTSRPLDKDVFKPDLLAKIVGKAPTPAPGGTKVKFIQISSADADALPSVDLPAGTRIETFDGQPLDTVGPTKVHAVPGLVDGHTNRQAVVINTGAVYDDKVRRLTILVAIAP